MTVELKVPEVGESITEVYIGEWRKAEGDPVDRDEDVVELESEKATFDAPAPTAGVISKILKKSGESAEVGEVIAYIEESEEAAPPKKETKSKSAERPATEKPAGRETPPKRDSAERHDQEPKRDEKRPPAEEAEEPEEAAERPPRKSKAVEEIPEAETAPRVMPAAGRVLAEKGLSPEDVKATGPGGRLLKEDVLRHVKGAGEAPPPERWAAVSREETEAAAREEETVPMTPIRRRIAERLVQAQQSAALLTTFNEIDMAAVKALRQKHREAFEKKYNVKLGFMSFFVKAVIDALKLVPQVNAEIRGGDIVYRNYYDIGIAVGGGKGLVVPVLRNAERMSFADIELMINDLARRAQENKLKVEELQGGTFTISNGGIYGSLLSTPIVNPPQSGVLGMHAIQDRPVVVEGQIVIRPMMYVALTYDHRLIDGREAVTFLKHIKEVIEDPARMLLEV